MAKKRINPLKKPVQKRSHETVKAILKASVHILNKQGWDSFTTRNIADTAGVSYGSLYQYFPNRESILKTITLELLENDLQELTLFAKQRDHSNYDFKENRDLRDQRDQQELQEIINEFVSLLLKLHENQIGLRTVVYQKLAELNLGAEVLKVHQKLISIFGELLMNLNEKNKKNKTDSKKIEILFYSVLGVCHSLEILHLQMTSKEIHDSLVHLIMGYITN